MSWLVTNGDHVTEGEADADYPGERHTATDAPAVGVRGRLPSAGRSYEALTRKSRSLAEPSAVRHQRTHDRA